MEAVPWIGGSEEDVKVKEKGGTPRGAVGLGGGCGGGAVFASPVPVFEPTERESPEREIAEERRCASM